MSFIAARTEVGWVVLAKDAMPHLCDEQRARHDHDITGCGEREDRWHLGWKRGIALVKAKLCDEADSFGDQYLGNPNATADGAHYVDDEHVLDILLLTLQMKENA